jgi:outer membrane lipopolysaccharide assembly protein LptE/RlpB
MLKKIFLLILFVLTTSCGFEAIHSKANRIVNSNLIIAKINYDGDRETNIKIKEGLSLYKSNQDETTNPESIFIKILDIESNVTREIAVKDSKGNPSIYKLEVEVTVLATKSDDSKKNYRLEKNSKYDYNSDSSALKESEKELKRSLAETITNELVFKLTSGQ